MFGSSIVAGMPSSEARLRNVVMHCSPDSYFFAALFRDPMWDVPNFAHSVFKDGLMAQLRLDMESLETAKETYTQKCSMLALAIENGETGWELSQCKKCVQFAQTRFKEQGETTLQHMAMASRDVMQIRMRVYAILRLQRWSRRCLLRLRCLLRRRCLQRLR